MAAAAVNKMKRAQAQFDSRNKVAVNGVAAAPTKLKSALKQAPPASVNDDRSHLEDDDEQYESGDETDESDDVTEEALERMMKLLGDVDAKELGLLATDDDESGGEDDEVDSDDDDHDDDDDDDDDGEADDEELVAASTAEESSDDGEQDEEEGDGDEDETTLLRQLGSNDEDETESTRNVVPLQRTAVNDKVALERVLDTFKTKVPFMDTLTLTNPTPLNVPDADNDLERELEFYKQALWGAEKAMHLFDEAKVPFHRPADYFAEMVKSDAHMSTIRQSLLDESAAIKASENARKLREAKKFGKKVQVERLKERQKEKADVGKRLESLKKKRKNGEGFDTTEDFDVALEEALAGPTKKRKMLESERRQGRGKMSRRGRDNKHGFPTSSRRPKENNARLDGDGSRGGGGGRRGGKPGARRGGKPQRPGKSRRQ
ncbi:rRNA-processing protein EBP2 [Microbotryomycetes sp. JL221]|nr:rRNA-processing protein EBP2 [Microbotryomycetes sp. JL221]